MERLSRTRSIMSASACRAQRKRSGSATNAWLFPVAWPFAHYGAARTGGIGLGNLNLEFLDPGLPFLAPHQLAGIGLVAFQPAPRTVDDLTAALARRRVPHQSPVTTGSLVSGFTNVNLGPFGID